MMPAKKDPIRLAATQQRKKIKTLIVGKPADLRAGKKAFNFLDRAITREVIYHQKSPVTSTPF